MIKTNFVFSAITHRKPSSCRSLHWSSPPRFVANQLAPLSWSATILPRAQGEFCKAPKAISGKRGYFTSRTLRMQEAVFGYLDKLNEGAEVLDKGFYLKTLNAAAKDGSVDQDEFLQIVERAMRHASKKSRTWLLESTFFWNAVILGFCLREDFKNMFSFFMNMQQYCVPDNATFSRMILAVGKKGDTDSVANLLHVMQKMNLEPDERTYTTVLASFGRSGQPERVYELLAAMKKQMRVDLVVYNALLSAFGHAGHFKHMENIFNRMLDDTEPGIIAFNTVINCYGKAGDIKNMEKYYRMMLDLRIDPDEVTLLGLLLGYKQTADVETMESYVRRFKEYFKVELSVECINQLIQAYLKKGDLNAVQKYYQMTTENNLQPNGTTFFVMMHVAESQKNIELATQYLKTMEEYGIPVEIKHINLMMSIHSKLGEYGKVLKYFDQIYKEGLQPNLSTFEILVNTLRVKKDVPKLLEMFALMQELHIQPTPDIYFQADKIIDRVMEELTQAGEWYEAAGLLSKVYGIKVPLTRQTFNTFLTNFVRNCPYHPRRSEAFQLTKRIYKGASYQELSTFIQCLLMDNPGKKQMQSQTRHQASNKQESFDWTVLDSKNDETMSAEQVTNEQLKKPV